MNSEPSQLWYDISSVIGSIYQGTGQKSLGFLRDLQKLNLFANIPSNNRSNMKYQIKKKSSGYQFLLALQGGRNLEQS